MKSRLSIIVLLVSFLSLQNLFGQTISIGSPATTDVCNAQLYVYSATTSGLNPNKSYYANWIVSTGTYTEGTISGVKVTWEATTSSNVGTLKVQLKDAANNSVVATSNEITFKIKSIKHLKAEIPMFNYMTTYPIDPCSSGVLNLSTANMYEPVTNTQVINYRWKVPAGWSLSGQLSNGTDWIYSGQNVSATYPASTTGGTIEVQGSIVVLGCTAETQFSNTSAAVTVSRTANFLLTANNSNPLCGDTSPVTFTVTPALSCATYYWNGSTTPSTSNTYQITPNGSTNFTATVNIFYGGTSQTKTKTINYIKFDPKYLP